VNVMVVHAGAGRRAVRNDPDGAEQAFDTIETTGRSALDELDRVLGLLRDEDREMPLSPLPDLDAVPALVADFEQAGLHVEMTIDGPAETVPKGLGLSVYRIVQEALTNTMKHSEATEASVAITVDEHQVRVVISDEGPASRSIDSVPDAPGRGLTGITERVQLHGGSVHFDSDAPGAGFTVDCTMPLSRVEASS